MEIDTLKYIKGRKSVGIQVKDGKVHVRAPKGIAQAKLALILRGKEGWIVKKLAEYEAAAKLNRDITGYEKFLFLGEKFDYGAVLTEILKIKEAVATESKTNPFNQTANQTAAAARLKRLKKEYVKLAARLLPDFLLKASRRTEIEYKSLKIINSKARWGSCNANGVVSLNWRLLMLPQGIIEYVVIHELCHLKIMNHSKEYWQALEKIYNGIPAAKKWLKDNNHIIKLF